jgi:rhamnose transport system substrate-binding protein
MRRSAVAAVALLAAATLAACSSTPGSSRAGSSESGGQSSGSQGGTKVAMVTQIEGIPYFKGFQSGAQKMASELGVDYTQTGPAKVDSAEQVRVLDNLIAQKYDAIAISPLDPTSVNASISKARSAGIAVATSDADAPKSERQVFVSQATDDALGAAVIDEIAKPMGGKGEYAIVSGSADTQTFINWLAAMDKRQKSKYPDMKLVGGIRHTLDSAAAFSEAQNLITAFPDLKAIIAVPSTAVPGVAQAVQNSGKIGKIAVTGYGSPQTAGPFLDSGAMTSTVFWDAEKLGSLTVWALDKIAKGESFDAQNDVPGFDKPIAYDDSTKTLLLGPPQIFTKKDWRQYKF